MDTIYPLSAVRALALHTQGLSAANAENAPPNLETIFNTIDAIGALQIDTLQVTARAHYLTLWARLGTYDMNLLDHLAFDPAERRIFEGWQHAACYIPTHEYRYQMPHQKSLASAPSSWHTTWLAENHNADTVAFVKKRITAEGALKVSDFERGDHPPGSWWNWRPAKVALEYLYATGDLMIARRDKFQRVYDLKERILPDWVDKTAPTLEERNLFWVERGGKALGVFAERQAADYTWMKLGAGRPTVKKLVKQGVFIPIQARLYDNEIHQLFVHRDNLSLLEQAADGSLKPERTTFLNPFDNLFWAQQRDETLWGFWQRLEAYTPAAKRRYGYFSLPILHKGNLVGRFDPKLERKTGLLRLKSLHLEEQVQPDEDLISALATALRDFMRFHSASDLLIENSNPPDFGSKLTQAI